jgi:glycosyltransferase involved in cell wall biosynthesis
MKVSVVTAVFNGSRTILSTLSSVADQRHRDVEHIIIDGASTDDTLAIVSSCGLRVTKTVSERDAGVYDAFNKGLRQCTGDVIGFLNSGDSYISSDVLSRIADEFADSDVDAVYGDVAIVDQVDGRRVRRYRSSRFTPQRIAYGFMPAHPTLFLRRRVYEKFGEYDTSFRIAGDFELVARIFGSAELKSTYLPDVLVRMPRGGLSTSGLRSKWIITKEMRRACFMNGIPSGWIRLCLRFPLKLTEVFDRET